MGDTAQTRQPVADAARPEEQEAAVRLLLRHVPEDLLPRRLAASLRMLETGEMDPLGLRVLRQGTDLLGATAGTVVPGGSGIVWPAQGSDAAAEDRLMLDLLAWLRGRGACLAQALLSPDETHLAGPLLRNGFRYVTDLWYLRHDRDIANDLFDSPSRLTFQTFAQADSGVFSETMRLTFDGTLDCPEVTTARPIEEVIRGFREQGVFDPACWWLAWDGPHPAGVLLTSAVPEEDNWEVIYVGVVPTARGRGFGRELMLKALLEVRAAGVPEVFLTVDERNAPARDLYHSLGFEAFDRHAVFLILLEPLASATSVRSPEAGG